MRPLILDACVLINLAASRRLQTVVSAGGYRPIIARQAADEALGIENVDGTREAIDCEGLAIEGVAEIWGCVDEELITLIDLAQFLGEGEAASLALGLSRGVAVATDDRPARRAARRLDPPVELVSTSQLLRAWATTVTSAEVSEAIGLIESRASFRPPRVDPNSGWWDAARRRE